MILYNKIYQKKEKGKLWNMILTKL